MRSANALIVNASVGQTLDIIADDFNIGDRELACQDSARDAITEVSPPDRFFIELTHTSYLHTITSY